MATTPNILILYPAEGDAPAKLEHFLSFISPFFPTHKTYSSEQSIADSLAALEWANVVIPLINQKYLNTPLHLQLKARLFERLLAKEVLVFPILISTSLFRPDSPLRELAPPLKQPLNKIADLDEAFSELVSNWLDELPLRIKELAQHQAEDEQKEVPPTAPPITSPEHLADSLLYLNYSDQREAFQDYRRTSYQRRFNPVNLFLLSGTHNCGHDLFVRSFLEEEQIDVEPFFLDLHAFRSNSTSIWAALKTTLALTGRSFSPNYVCGQIIEILKERPIILLLDNIHEDRDNYIGAINAFWQKLYQEYLLPKKADLPNRFFVFIMDKVSDRAYGVSQFIPPNSAGGLKQLVEILPPISPAKRNDLEDWTDTLRRFRDDIKLKISQHFEGKIDLLFPNGEDSILMLDLVEKIIKESQLESQKDLIYKKLNLSWLEE
ncbi:MAG: hypothetical protein AAF798_08845 [Bacteroidota bacterium]